MSGGCVGISATCIMYPFDFVEIRMWIYSSFMHDSVKAKPDHILTRTIVNIVEKKSILIMYSGIISPIILETAMRVAKSASINLNILSKIIKCIPDESMYFIIGWGSYWCEGVYWLLYSN